MSKKIQTKTRTSTSTLIATALLAGAGLAAAAGLAATSSLRAPALLIRLTPGQARTTEVVRGSEDVQILSLDLQPRGGAATVDMLGFTAFGDLDADFAAIDRDADPDERLMECALYDSAGAVVAGPVPAASGYLIFSDTFTVPTAVVSTYAVRCDLSGTETADGDADRFAINIGGEPGVTASIGGTALAGSTLIIGSTAYDTLNETGNISIRVQDEGRLTLRAASDMPASDIVLGASANVDIGRWEFQASGEDFLIETISFDDAADDTAVLTAHLLCTNEDGSGYTDTESVSAGHVTFENAECYARVGDTTSITLSVDTATVGTDAASGDTFRYVLNALDSGSFSAVGVTSGNDYDETDVASTVSGREMTLRQSEPVFSLSSSTPSGAGTPGLDEVLRINVSAESNGDVTVDQLVFRVTATDNDATGWNDCGDGASAARLADTSLWSLYDLDDPSTPISDAGDWAFLKAGGGACRREAQPVGYAVLNLAKVATTGSLEVSAGETRTLGLNVDTTGASAVSDDSVRFDLLSEDEARALRLRAIVWDDETEATDISGSLLQVLPLLGSTVTY